MIDFITEPWPWYVAGPLIGLMVPLLLFLGNRSFGVSSSFRHLCSSCLPARIPYFDYDWKKEGGWNLWLIAGMLVGGFLGGYVFRNPDPVALNMATVRALSDLGISDFTHLVPAGLFSWGSLLTLPGLIIMVAGGFLVGFGARYAGGCTSGHAITGMANLQLPSLVAVCGFFAGGLITTYILLPLILSL